MIRDIETIPFVACAEALLVALHFVQDQLLLRISIIRAYVAIHGEWTTKPRPHGAKSISSMVSLSTANRLSMLAAAHLGTEEDRVVIPDESV